MTRRYWMLVASLPHLPRHDRAERVPIGPERLAARLQMLVDTDRARLQSACALLDWKVPIDDDTDAMTLAEAARQWAAGEADALVRELVLGRLTDRALLAALRRRRVARPPPAGVPGLPWPLHRHWSDPSFGLGARLPWLAEAQALLARHDAIALERLTCSLEWSACARVRRDAPRTFAAVLAYRLQWNVLHRWLGRDAAEARTTLQALADAALALR